MAGALSSSSFLSTGQKKERSNQIEGTIRICRELTLLTYLPY